MSIDVRGTDPADKPEPDPVSVVVSDKVPDPSLTMMPLFTAAPGKVYVVDVDNELGAFSVNA